MTIGDARPLPTRGELLALAGRTAVVLCVGGAVLGAAEAPARAAAGGDLDTLRVLAAGERLAVELYERAATTPALGVTLATWIAGATANERDHQRALSAAAPRMRIGAVRLARATAPPTAASVLGLARALESALAGTYLGAVETLESADLRVMAAAIGANEAQHLAAVERLAAGRLVDSPALGEALSDADARAALGARAAGSRLPW